MPVLGMGNTWLQIWQRRSTLDPKRERKSHRYFFNETKCPIALGPQGRRIKGCFTIPPILFHFPFIHHLSWRHCWSSIMFGTSSMGSNPGEFKFWNTLVLRTVGKKKSSKLNNNNKKLNCIYTKSFYCRQSKMTSPPLWLHLAPLWNQSYNTLCTVDSA